ncbi:hypothetical protein CAAN1_03S03070 [[Candida] anglica]|uniref:Eukaryotic translation initiation factor 3 subunit M n=1 Tax=[Candida] anglica TaxID=148631 RepID=A0ABP0EH92_9ASCO
MHSVIIVEQELEQSVRGYAQILDTANGNTEVSQALLKYFNDAKTQITDKKALAEAVLASASTANLGQLPDKEFEPTYNLVLYILTQLVGPVETLLEQYPQILTNLVASNPTQQPSLRDRKSIKSTTILSLLNNVFNLLPEQSAKRVVVLNKILEVVAQSGLDFQLISGSIGDNLVSWLSAAGASEQDIKSTFWRFVSLDSASSLKTLQLIKTFTQEHTISAQELNQLIEFALESEVVDVSFLVNHNVAHAIKSHAASDDFVQLFDRYTNGELLVQSSLVSPQLIAKSQILALAKFFATSTQSIFQYKDIPAELASSSVELETLLINAIKSGVIEGKLNQLTETFYLTRANRFVLAGADNSQNWDNVQAALNEWKQSLHNINEIVNTTRENIVKDNQS